MSFYALCSFLSLRLSRSFGERDLELLIPNILRLSEYLFSCFLTLHTTLISPVLTHIHIITPYSTMFHDHSSWLIALQTTSIPHWHTWIGPSTTTTATSTSFISSTSTIATPIPSPAQTGVNPVTLAGIPKFLGNVSSSNTPDIRDLGFMGNIGSTYIMTFGDTIPCIAWQDQCVDLEAPNSAGIITSSDNDTQFTDVNVDSAGHAEIFCPMVDGEPPSFGLGLSNVVETSDEQGIVFFTRDNRSTLAGQIVGSGVAFVNITSGKPVCTRPNAQWWNGTVEPYFGDHNVILSPQDNYIYAYGGLLEPGYGQNVFLTRVPQWGASYLWAYQYWNGTAFTTDRLINPSTNAAVFWAGQGSIMWSEYYQKYLYFQPGLSLIHI